MNNAARAVILLIFPLWIALSATSTHAEAESETFDPEAFDWAYGLMVDSIYVVGDIRTQDWVLIREMETRVGHRLDKEKFTRDQRFISDLTPVASAEFTVEPTGPGTCQIRMEVVERHTLLLKLIYPILEYDFNRERWKYGFRWRDRNFRGRLQSLSADATRDSRNNDSFSANWGSRWIGWKHIGVGGGVAYFRRDKPTEEFSIMERTAAGGAVSLPLTDSRIAFAQVTAGLSLANQRFSAIGEPSRTEVVLTPTLGYAFDNRNSGLKPTRGRRFSISLSPSRVINGEGSSYYLLRNDLRLFFSMNSYTVLALHSNLAYQFGKFPDYVRFGLGGSQTLRGYNDNQFRGNHRWVQSAELRFTPLPKWFFQLPFFGKVDLQIGGVAFVDGGIVWNNPETFVQKNVRGGGGIGLRIYSPLQDVIRLDLAVNGRGHIRPYFTTGTRF